jgi:hypothetical protein
MADRKISQLPEFPHDQVYQNADIYYVVASGLAAENRDATNYRIPFTGLVNDVNLALGGGSPIFFTDTQKIHLGAVDDEDVRDVTLRRSIYVAGDVNGDHNFYLTGDAFVGENLIVTGHSLLEQSLKVEGDSTVIGDTFLNSDVFITDNLSVTGDSFLQSDLHVSDHAYIGQTFVVSGDSHMRDDLYVAGDTTISGNLTILGDDAILETEKLVVEDSNIELGNKSSAGGTNQDSANFGGITLKTHDNTTHASIVLDGVTITAQEAGENGNLISITILGIEGDPGIDDYAIIDKTANPLIMIELFLACSAAGEITERTQADLAELINCSEAGHLIKAAANNSASSLISEYQMELLDGGAGAGGVHRYIQWLKECDTWRMNTNFYVDKVGVFGEGVRLPDIIRTSRFAGQDVYEKPDNTNNLLYSHITTGESKSDLYWEDIAISAPFTGSTSTNNGIEGLVPQPKSGEEDYYIKGDGSWSELILATDTVPGAVKIGLQPVYANVVFEGITIQGRNPGADANKIRINSAVDPALSENSTAIPFKVTEVTDSGTGITTLTVTMRANSITEVTRTDFSAALNGPVGSLWVNAIPTPGTGGTFLANNAVNLTLSGGVDPGPGYGGLYMEGGFLKFDGWSSLLEAQFYSSDARLKNNFKKVSNPLDLLNSIDGVYFNWSENSRQPGFYDIGITAQDVEAVLPMAVESDSNGYKTVAYHKLIPVLIESIKELQHQNQELKSRIDSLES